MLGGGLLVRAEGVEGLLVHQVAEDVRDEFIGLPAGPRLRAPILAEGGLQLARVDAEGVDGGEDAGAVLRGEGLVPVKQVTLVAGRAVRPPALLVDGGGGPRGEGACGVELGVGVEAPSHGRTAVVGAHIAQVRLVVGHGPAGEEARDLAPGVDILAGLWDSITGFTGAGTHVVAGLLPVLKTWIP